MILPSGQNDFTEWSKRFYWVAKMILLSGQHNFPEWWKYFREVNVISRAVNIISRPWNQMWTRFRTAKAVASFIDLVPYGHARRFIFAANRFFATSSRFFATASRFFTTACRPPPTRALTTVWRLRSGTHFPPPKRVRTPRCDVSTASRFFTTAFRFVVYGSTIAKFLITP